MLTSLFHSIDASLLRRAAVAVVAAVICVSVGVMIGRHGESQAVTLFGYVAAALFLVVFSDIRSRPVSPVIPDRIRQALDTLSEGLLIMDESERIILANKSFCEAVRRSAKSLVGSKVSDLPWVCSANAIRDDFPWVRAIQDENPQLDQLMRYRLPGGDFCFFSINASPITAEEASGRGALATFRDVTEGEEHRAELEQMLAMLRNSRDEISSKNRELEILATQDALTGCLNRRALFAILDETWSQATRDQTSLGCLMIDADHFKQVNDRHGHQTGDEVLRVVAEVIRVNCGDDAMVCRYGGEEFCVIQPYTDLDGAATLAETIRAAVEQVQVQPHSLRLTVSIGVSALRFDTSDPHQLINQADKCLYAAKRSGRNRVVVFDDQIAELSDDITHGVEMTNAEAEESTGVPFQAVTALVSALAYRDSETAEHSRRVADLCVRCASGILDQKNTYILEIAALLHDIGKIGVPDNVLLKPGELTSDEWSLMRRHERIGVEIVAGTFNNSELNEIIRSHQAHFSGRESDLHLPEGNDIPLAARLLKIADSYDAMVSDHVYRDGCSHDNAIAELKRCAGTQFDPVLVDHFAATISRASAPRGSSAIPKLTAIQIGLQIERIADALDARDVDGLQTLASRLGAIARHHRIESIASAADKIESAAAEENMQWINLLRDTQMLLNLCRVTQNTFLQDQREEIS